MLIGFPRLAAVALPALAAAPDSSGGVVGFISLMRIRHFVLEHASEASRFQEIQGGRV